MNKKKSSVLESKNVLSTILQSDAKNIILSYEEREKTEEIQQNLDKLETMQYAEHFKEIIKKVEDLYGK